MATENFLTDSINASIIVCTYNRAESLRDTLHALKTLKVAPHIRWEVIVVDNNSRDHTRQIVSEFQRNWTNLRYVFEAEQGLSHARNRGLSQAHGEIILFTDDDVLPEPEWLENTLSGLDRHQADACGGFIAPLYESPPPAWFTPRFHGFIAVRCDRDDDYQITNAEEAPFGANMAFRRHLFDHVGIFDTTRGRKGKTLASGEDGEMFERILAAGYKVVFLGNARVHHKVERFRVTRRYLLRWRYHTSRNIAVARGVEGDRQLFNIPLYMYTQTVRAALRTLYPPWTIKSDERVHRLIILSHFLGTMSGLLVKRQKTVR